MEQSLELASQVSVFGLAGAGLEMDHDVDFGQRPPYLETAVDLSNPPLHPVPNHRIAHLAASGDAEPGTNLVVAVGVQSHQASMVLAAPAVTAKVIRAAPQALRTI